MLSRESLWPRRRAPVLRNPRNFLLSTDTYLWVPPALSCGRIGVTGAPPTLETRKLKVHPLRRAEGISEKMRRNSGEIPHLQRDKDCPAADDRRNEGNAESW